MCHFICTFDICKKSFASKMSLITSLHSPSYDDLQLPLPEGCENNESTFAKACPGVSDECIIIQSYLKEFQSSLHAKATIRGIIKENFGIQCRLIIIIMFYGKMFLNGRPIIICSEYYTSVTSLYFSHISTNKTHFLHNVSDPV